MLPDSRNTTTVCLRVLYADTDRMGVVYYGNYLRFFEVGRSAYMRARGSSYDELERNGTFLPVVESHVDYKRSAGYDEELEISTWLGELGRAQVRFAHSICRGAEVLASGYTRHAVTNAAGKPGRLPEKLAQALLGPACETHEDILAT
ncbi:MAG: acyl-CoA thioesterase [Myxococcota bacterium]|jgi:acyl-CoA thioester hydrolase|nr:acyl-CoA thioesterase [Myxococcota bacterium]